MGSVGNATGSDVVVAVAVAELAWCYLRCGRIQMRSCSRHRVILWHSHLVSRFIGPTMGRCMCLCLCRVVSSRVGGVSCRVESSRVELRKILFVD
jgi:hypothetical protein